MLIHQSLKFLSQYEWSLINTTAGSSTKGNMANAHEKMTVSGLGEGVYRFKVVVTGSDPRAEGEGFGVVTVLPRELLGGVNGIWQGNNAAGWYAPQISVVHVPIYTELLSCSSRSICPCVKPWTTKVTRWL